MAAKPKADIADVVAEKQQLGAQVAELKEMVLQQQTLLKQITDEKVDSGALPIEEIVRFTQLANQQADRPAHRPLSGKEREELDAIDPLAFIDESTAAVMLVSRIGSMAIRQETISRHGHKIPKLRLRHLGNATPWISCPYVFKGATAADTESAELMNKDWHRFKIDVRMAEQAWIGEDPFPLESVITQGEMGGIEGRQILGTKRPSSGIDLRELVRWILQVNPQNIWFDTDFYCPGINGKIQGFKFVGHTHIDALEPNPYHRGCVTARGNIHEMYATMPMSPFPEGMAINTGRSAELANPETGRVLPEDVTPSLQ